VGKGALYGDRLSRKDNDPVERGQQTTADSISSELSGTSALCLIEPEDFTLWLEKGFKKIVVVGGENPNHPQIQFFELQTFLQLDLIAKTIAWEAIFLGLHVVGGEGEVWEGFKRKLFQTHIAAKLLLSDSADFGVTHFKNWLNRKKRKIRNGLFLKDAFRGIPAVIVGAGPSLKKDGALLEQLKTKALLFSGGSSLTAMKVEPHFAALVDPKAPYERAKKYAFQKTPYFFQSRVSGDNFSLIDGEAIWMPESSQGFLNFLDGEETAFEAGWTVGTFQAAIAKFMGCDPILLLGMDLCYEDGAKYAHLPNDEAKIALCEIEGKVTQLDWLMARDFLEDLSLQGGRWIDARSSGLELKGAFEKCAIDLPEQKELCEKVSEKLSALPFLSLSEERLLEWRRSLEQGEGICYEKLLLPLWDIWRPLFANLEGDIEIHKQLFFDKVIEAHLNA